MGAYLGRAGLKCVILEREKFPREHVGESLVPSSTRVLKDLGFLETMEEHKFVKKYGAVWTSSAKSPIYDVQWEGLSPDMHADIRFAERQQAGVDRNYTYHVDRGKFDELLLKHAASFGAEVYEETTVKGVDFDDSGVTIRVEGKYPDRTLRARMVVDASGRKTVLGNRLKIKEVDPIFKQFAIHTWFDNADRAKLSKKAEHADFIIIHFLHKTNTWMWQIPITDTITSMGVVTHKGNFDLATTSHEEFFWDCIRARPELYEALRAGNQLRPLKVEGDYSYAMKRFCGDRWVLIGDAARFVDPIFSSGVAIALNSARIAATDIIEAFQKNDLRRESFERFERIAKSGARNWYEFIHLYYRLNVLFTAFIQNPKTRLDVLALLQGDLYNEERPPVLDEMRRVVEQVERNPQHPWHSHLGDMAAPVSEPMQVVKEMGFSSPA